MVCRFWKSVLIDSWFSFPIANKSNFRITNKLHNGIFPNSIKYVYYTLALRSVEVLKFHFMELSHWVWVWGFHGIPWNSVLASSSMLPLKFHGIPWHPHPHIKKLPWYIKRLILICFIIREWYFVLCSIACDFVSADVFVVQIFGYPVS